MKIAAMTLAVALSLSLTAVYAEGVDAPLANADNLLNVILLNNSNYTLIYQESGSPDQTSQCQLAAGSKTLAPHQFMIIKGTYTSQGGPGLSCRIEFSNVSGESSDIYLEIMDPTYIYQGGQEFRLYDGDTPVSSEYMPAENYPNSDPQGLIDSNVTLMINPF